jgi:GDP-4-dehydro-6-deoxy-D-mannose reductase
MIDAVITGGSGFIGTRLVNRLRANGVQVLALSSRDGDVASSSTWERLPAARILFHLAGRSYVPDSWTNSAAFMHANVVGVEQALAYCRRVGARMVLASAYIYGVPRRLPISESDHASPNNPYAMSKWLAEELGSFASAYHGVPVTALRIFNVYGRGQREEFLIPSIIRQVKEGNAIHVQDLTPKRDFVHVEDVVDSLLCAAKESSGFRRFNIGSGASISVAEIIDTIQRIAGTNLPVESTNHSRKNEIPDVQACILSASECLGWVGKLTFEQGIREILSESLDATSIEI